MVTPPRYLGPSGKIAIAATLIVRLPSVWCAAPRQPERVRAAGATSPPATARPARVVQSPKRGPCRGHRPHMVRKYILFHGFPGGHYFFIRASNEINCVCS